MNRSIYQHFSQMFDLWESESHTKEGTVEIPTSGMPAARYILRLSNDKMSLEQNFVIQH